VLWLKSGNGRIGFQLVAVWQFLHVTLIAPWGLCVLFCAIESFRKRPINRATTQTGKKNTAGIPRCLMFRACRVNFQWSDKGFPIYDSLKCWVRSAHRLVTNAYLKGCRQTKRLFAKHSGIMNSPWWRQFHPDSSSDLPYKHPCSR